MLDSFYAAFSEELSKIAAGMRDPKMTFESWREHFERTGDKRIGAPRPVKGMEEHGIPKPGSKKPKAQVKKGAIWKRISASPSVAI